VRSDRSISTLKPRVDIQAIMTIFGGSDLRGAAYLTQEQIGDALGNADTKLPG